VDSPTTTLAVILAVAYGPPLIALARRGREHLGPGTRTWLLLALIAASASAAVHILPDDAHTDTRYADFFIGELTQPALAIIIINLMLVLFGNQTLRFLQYPRIAVPWTVLGLAWWAAQAVTSALEENLMIGQEGWLGEIYDPVVVPGMLAIGGWALSGLVLLFATFYAFYRAPLPEVANRALYWAILTPLVVMGAILGVSGSDGLAEAGWIIQYIGLLGAVYAVWVYRVFDIRRAVRQVTATAILTFVTALAVFAALIVARQIEVDDTAIYAVLAALALAVAMAYIPLRALAQVLVDWLMGSRARSVSHVFSQYSQDIAGAVELDTLVMVTMNALQQVLRVRRAGLILVAEEQTSGVCIEPLPNGMGEMPEIKGQLAFSSPIYEHLVKRRAPLLQYDLDFGRVYGLANAGERAFFQQMRMSAYAPVVVQNTLVGILCCGAKVSDDPFTEHDLELLSTIANQIGVALRNARLVADLRRREAEQAELNRALSQTKEQIERLDAVKTDFITIASHELRTPLAQIRGYTDIMEAMNQDGMLDQDQIAGMTSNLGKASDRLEDLIAAMLDVSQLDVNAMDLRFNPTRIENVIRMAIEPLTESIKNRKLMLSARGLRKLPAFEGDNKRLVQAFRNVVLNAIKFTPDGGRIDITGEQQDGEIVVAIHDSGIGIDPENHALIFEKFFRAHDPSLHSTGTTKFMGAGPGLGLTIAKGVIEGHGGRIWVESTGHDPEAFPGSTFYIALPLTPPDESKRVLHFEPSSSSSSTASTTSQPAIVPAPEPDPSPGDGATLASRPRDLTP
jgi:signal transduction histidine kinase